MTATLPLRAIGEISLSCESVLELATLVLESGERVVEGLRWAHHGRGLLGVGQVVAADVGGLALDREELRDDGVLLRGQRLGQPLERRRDLGVVGLLGQLLGPVERQVEVRAAVVERAELAARAAVLVKERA